MQMACYKMAGLSDERSMYQIRANKRIIIIVLRIGVFLCATDALAW